MQKLIGRPLLASVLLSTAAGAWAVPPGEDGLTLGAQFGVIRDDNPMLVTLGVDDIPPSPFVPPISEDQKHPHPDTIRYTQLSASYSRTISLQKLGVSANVKDARYQELTDLDYRSYNESAWWNWTLTDRFTGRLAYTKDRTPASLKYETSRELDLITRDSPEAMVAWALMPDWYIDARYVPASNAHTLEQKKYLDNDSTEYRYRLGLKHPTGYGGGVLLRDNELEYKDPAAKPAGSSIDSGYRDREMSFYANWAPGGRTRFDGKVGYQSREHNNNVERDYKGGIGNLNASYSLTGDTDLNASLARTIGGEEEDANGSYAVHRAATAGITHRITPLISSYINWRSEIIEFQNNLINSVIQIDNRVDREHIVAVGMSYKPHQLVDIGLNWQQDRRTSNIQFGGFKQQQVSLYLMVNY